MATDEVQKQIEPFPTASHEAFQAEVAENRLEVFVDSSPFVARLLDDLRSAKKRIWIEIYIFADDTVGRAVAAVLAERARAGVEVRVLYDAVGSFATSSSLFAELIAAGGKVQTYHSFWDGWARRALWNVLNRRNHRKLIVVDYQVSYFGGMNIVDVSLGDSIGSKSSKGWRDVQVRVAGTATAQAASSFDRSWRRQLHQPVRRRTRRYRRAALAPGEESIRLFDSGPGRRNTRGTHVYRRVIGLARRRAAFLMAYFLPTPRILFALLRARRRGVDISVVVPQTSDVPPVAWATEHLMARLLKRGFHLYERQDRMLHSKALVVDHEWTVLGSCNLDARSLAYNLELLVVIRSKRLAEIIERIIEQEIAGSAKVSPASVNARTWWRRLRARWAYWLRDWL